MKHPCKFLLSKHLESHLLYRDSVFDLQGELPQSSMQFITEAYWVQRAQSQLVSLAMLPPANCHKTNKSSDMPEVSDSGL